MITIFEINQICSFILSSKIRIFKINLRMFVTIKQMSLQKFFLKHKFRNNIIEISIFNRKMLKNNKKIFKNHKCSIKISSIRNSFVMKFTNVIVCVFFDKKFKIKSFSFATISLCIIKIVRFKKQSKFFHISFINRKKNINFVKCCKFCVLLIILSNKSIQSYNAKS